MDELEEDNGGKGQERDERVQGTHQNQRGTDLCPEKAHKSVQIHKCSLQ